MKRTKKIMLRLTESEYQKISENCQMPIARFIRETALGNAIIRRIVPPKVDPKLIGVTTENGKNSTLSDLVFVKVIDN